MAVLFDPHFQAAALGLPLSGARLHFYRAGTTSRITTYKDSAATTPHTNPVIADASGLFPPIFLAQVAPFKIILQSGLGITVQTIDRIPVGDVIDLDTIEQAVLEVEAVRDDAVALTTAQADRAEDEADRSEVARTGSEAARDIAAGYASDAATAGNGWIETTAVGVAGKTILPGVTGFSTRGYYADGDGGAAQYKLGAEGPGALQSADGRWWELVSVVVNPVMFGARRGRTNAATTISAINTMTRFCEATGAEFDLLCGSWFIDDTWEMLAPVSGKGRGIGYWHTYAPAFNNGKSQVAQTQIILTGTGPKNYHPHGMSSMRASGGVVANPSARAGWNEGEYALTTLNRDISIGLFISPEAWGSCLSGFRVLPDGGGDDGMDIYNDETATAASGWAADWDVGIWADATRKLVVRDVQTVGHFRIAGKISAAIPMDTTLAPPPAPYEQLWENCDFGGWRATAVRGADTFQITGIGSNYVEIDYAADHPFDPVVTPNFALSKNNFSHSAATFTGLSVLGGTLRLTGVSPNPDTGFDVGDSIVARLFGGGTSQVHHTNCRIHGMVHPSGRQCHDQALGADAMPNPGTAIEISGHRLVEVIFDNRCSIQSGEQVAYHLHDCGDLQLTDLVEFNTDIVGSARGIRVITSPSVASNNRVAHPCGQTYRPCFGDGSITNLLLNNGPSGCLDLRPSVNIPSAAFAVFAGVGDTGFMQANGLRIPALSLYQDMNTANGLRTPKGGYAGIFGSEYPSPVARLVYNDSLGYFVIANHLKSGGMYVHDVGDIEHIFRSIWARTHFIGDGTASIRAGTGSPQGVVSAPVGTLFLRTDGGGNSTLYIKESGIAATGWVAK